MAWAFLNEAGEVIYTLPASLWPDQRHVGGNARARFVRGYGSEDWFTTRDGLREPANVTIVGWLQTDRDEAGTQALIDDLVDTATAAHYLAHVGAGEALPLLGALPITTEPEGIDGSIVAVTLPLIPGGEWGVFTPPVTGDYLLLDSGGVMLLDAGGRALQQ